jgi:DNA-binding LacI/PurR family transcriptional regulator
MLVPTLITASFKNPFIAEFMNGVGTVCDEHSLSTLFVSPYEGSLLKATQKAPVDGFIVLGLNERHAEIEPLRQRNVRFVIVDGEADSVSQVNIDDEQGAYEAATHLLARGHTNMMILTFEKPEPSHNSDIFYGVGGRRYNGIHRAFQDAGVPFDFDLMVQSLTSMEGGRDAFLSAWQSGFHPSAVFALSDAMAIGVLAAAKQLGLHVPQDLEIIGFDDIPTAAFTNPTLSTVHQPIFEKGTTAAALLIHAISGKEKSQKILLPTKLVLRESTKL